MKAAEARHGASGVAAYIEAWVEVGLEKDDHDNPDREDIAESDGDSYGKHDEDIQESEEVVTGTPDDADMSAVPPEGKGTITHQKGKSSYKGYGKYDSYSYGRHDSYGNGKGMSKGKKGGYGYTTYRNWGGHGDGDHGGGAGGLQEPTARSATGATTSTGWKPSLWKPSLRR